jgi:hypothetical protein
VRDALYGGSGGRDRLLLFWWAGCSVCSFEWLGQFGDAGLSSVLCLLFVDGAGV